MTFGVSAVTITRRTAVCRGGSSSPSRRSSVGITTPGALNPDAFENVALSRSRARTLRVACDVVHPARDGSDRGRGPQLLQQRPGVVRLTRVERIERLCHGADPNGARPRPPCARATATVGVCADEPTWSRRQPTSPSTCATSATSTALPLVRCPSLPGAASRSRAARSSRSPDRRAQGRRRCSLCSVASSDRSRVLYAWPARNSRRSVATRWPPTDVRPSASCSRTSGFSGSSAQRRISSSHCRSRASAVPGDAAGAGTPGRGRAGCAHDAPPRRAQRRREPAGRDRARTRE